MIANSFLVPHIEINTNCKDYIIDMTSFILNEKEKEIASKIYSKTFYEFNVIVISRDSNIIGTSFDKINDNSAQKTSLYSLENANESRSLCIKLFKPSIAEQTKFQLPIPFCFITGGMNNYIKIWDAFNGKLLQKVEILSDFAADILLFQLGKNSLHIDEECTTQHNQNKIIKNLVIVGGAPKVIQIIDIEDFSLFQLKIDDHFSINTLELIGAFSNKGKVKKHLLFAIADKGEHLKVWKIKKKGPNLKYICLRRLQLNTYWILGLTSFKHSSDPYKSKIFFLFSYEQKIRKIFSGHWRNDWQPVPEKYVYFSCGLEKISYYSKYPSTQKLD